MAALFRPLSGLALILGACTAAGDRSPGGPAAADAIVEVASGRALDRADLLERLGGADYVLLGERHDNPVHHELQAAVTEALQGAGVAPRAVAFEMMEADEQLRVSEHLRAHPGDAAGLGPALDWAQSGWPAWELYRPIAAAALDGGGQIIAANLPRQSIRKVYAVGTEALRPAVVERTGLAEQLPEVLAVSLRQDLEAAHCGMVEGHMVDGMFQVQRARDATMADRLVAASGRGGGILIAGAEHVRKDRGVPWYIARLEPDADVVSLAFIEGEPSQDLADLPFDYVWFTTGVEGREAPEPCPPAPQAEQIGRAD